MKLVSFGRPSCPSAVATLTHLLPLAEVVSPWLFAHFALLGQRFCKIEPISKRINKLMKLVFIGHPLCDRKENITVPDWFFNHVQLFWSNRYNLKSLFSGHSTNYLNKKIDTRSSDNLLAHLYPKGTEFIGKCTKSERALLYESLSEPISPGPG